MGVTVVLLQMRPVSWGKIRINAKPVKVCADATIVFPLIVSQTFAKDVEQWKEDTKDCVCWSGDLSIKRIISYSTRYNIMIKIFIEATATFTNKLC